MRSFSIVLVILGIASIIFGVIDHFTEFLKVPFELYIFGVLGFILGAVGGTLGTLRGGVVPPPPASETDTPMIVE